MDHEHEAGYDAFMTGYTFVSAMSVLKNHPATIMTNAFHVSNMHYCNKVQLSSIKVPFNFTESNSSYEKDGTRQFFFTCLSHTNNSQIP
jgi:hypothetical protein